MISHHAKNIYDIITSVLHNEELRKKILMTKRSALKFVLNQYKKQTCTNKYTSLNRTLLQNNQVQKILTGRSILHFERTRFEKEPSYIKRFKTI